MPFTPFHLGPGLAIKAVAGRHFSFLTFGLAQVAMDIEPLVGLVRGAERLHGPSHTYLAALGIAGAVALLTPWLGRPVLRRWNREIAWARLSWLRVSEDFTRLSVIVGAVLGTVSHVLLDSLLYADMSPLAPWSSANPWLGLISGVTVEQGCLVAGLVGLSGWLAVAWLRGRRARIDCGAESPPR